MKKKILVLLIAMVLLMTGCNSRVENLSYSDGEYQYSQVSIYVDNSYLAKKNILPNRVREYATIVAALYGYSIAVDDGQSSSRLMTVVKKTLIADLPASAPDDEGESNRPIETGRNWFYATYAYETANPFAEVSKQYKDTVLTYVKGDHSTYNTTNLAVGAVLKNGLATKTGDITTLVVAPFLSEFPALAGEDLSGIQCMFYWGNSKNMSTNGNKIKIQGNTFYVFSTNFDEDSATIKYEMFYPVSLGWNLVAIGGAIVVVVLILLLAKKGRRGGVSAILEPDKLNKPIIIDPFDSKPIEKTSSKVNPFDGY